MTAPAEVAALADAWARWHHEPGFPFEKTAHGYCINGTRVAIDTLARLGIKAKPISVGVLLFNRFAWDLYQRGVPTTEWPYHAHSIGIQPTGSIDGLGWDGHLIAEGDGWTLDISAQTMERPGRIIVPAPRVIESTIPIEGFGAYTDDHGQVLLLERTPENNRWRHAPGWRFHDNEVEELLSRMANDTVNCIQTQT